MIQVSRAIQIYMIVLSISISYHLATTAKNINSLELGALFNFFFPFLLGLITIILYLFLSLLIKNKTLDLISTIVLSLINIYLGFVFHFGLHYFPLN